MHVKSIVIPFLFAFPVLAETELKGSPDELKRFLHPEVKTISISQNAQEIAFKDQAVISMLVTTEDDQLAVSLAKNEKIRKTISATLIASNINQKDINNSKFSTSPDYGWFGDDPDKYKVANTINVRIKDEGGLQSVAKIVDKYKEVTLVDTKYEHSKAEEYKQKVKQKALDKVLAEKAFYSKSLGMTLKAVSFIDHNVFEQDDIERIAVTGSRMKRKYLSSDEMQPPAHSSFEKVTYRANVTVTFTVQ